MSVIDLSKAVERREARDEHMAWCMKRWGGDLLDGREEGIAWAKNPANERYVLNLWSWYALSYENMMWLDPDELDLSVYELLYRLRHTEPADDEPLAPIGPLPSSEEDFKASLEALADEMAAEMPIFRQQRGLDRPVAEIVADLADIIGEESTAYMVDEIHYKPRFRLGWIAGAMGYWDAVRPDVAYCDEAQPPD